MTGQGKATDAGAGAIAAVAAATTGCVVCLTPHAMAARQVQVSWNRQAGGLLQGWIRLLAAVLWRTTGKSSPRLSRPAGDVFLCSGGGGDGEVVHMVRGVVYATRK